ncbi:MAG: hypothetical protein RLZZ126_1568, partial [Pseudomonadota bacterium]
TGPCGPCSEIFFDHGPEVAGGPPGSPDADGDRYIEIWNHVFMQFDMQPDGSVKKLPAPCVDTGMGLERLAAILQHVHSNYEIDIFEALIQAAAMETGCADLANPSLKVIADHIRATAFLVSDGVVPSADGRGYVQRRIIRRAIRHGYKLGQKKPFFHKLVPTLVALMGDAYPRLKDNAPQVMQVLKAEEERFYETLATGMEILDEEIARGKGEWSRTSVTQIGEKKHHKMEISVPQTLLGGTFVLSGELAFKLHDTYGFPLDLTQDVCRERGVQVDVDGFNAAMDKQKATARAAGKFKMDRALDYSGSANTFVGYEKLEIATKIVAIYVDGLSEKELKSGQEGVVVMDATPFYAESGGQVGDAGTLRGAGSLFQVDDTQKIKADVYGHHGSLAQGALKVGDAVTAQVNLTLRAATVRNHSATHLMHKALREVLGSHVQQKGSLVNAERTRFDFAHGGPVTVEQIKAIEAQVNAEILANVATQARVMSIDEAQKTGAMMLFGEKYGDSVRVLDIGGSRELCGGTHVQRTGDIGFFKVVAESGVAAGVRRIEAVTGLGALTLVQGLEAQVESAAVALKTAPAQLQERITHTLEHVRLLEKELAMLKGKLASSQGDGLLAQALELTAADGKTLKLLVASLEGADVKQLRDSMDKLKDKLKSAVIVLAVKDGGKVQVAAGVTADWTAKVKAGELVNHVASQIGGKGGGKPDLAMAGGTDAAALPGALASVQAWVQAKV